MRRILPLLFATLLCAVPLAAQQQCSDLGAAPQTAEQASQLLDKLDTSGCLGGTTCPTAICMHFKKWHEIKDGPGALELLTDIRNTVRESGSDAATTRLVGKIDEWIDAVGKDAVALSAPAQWQLDNGGLFRGTPSQIDLDADLAAQCGKGAEPCTQAFRGAAMIMTAAALVRRINTDLLQEQRNALKKYVGDLDQRWEDYFNRAPSQFPWELAINSSIYRKRERRGFNEPPSWQLMAFHPAAAYEYASDAQDKFKSALALDTIGYYSGHVGAALAVAWADRSDAQKLGYGITAHWEGKVTLGVIHHGGGGGTAVLVSPHVEKFVTARVKQVRDLLTRAH